MIPHKKSFILEVLSFFSLLMLAIWICPRGLSWRLGVGLLGLIWIATSIRIRKDTWEDLGFGQGQKSFWLFTLACFGGLFLLAWILNPEVFAKEALWSNMAKKLGYPTWAIIQQFLLQSYLANRIAKCVDGTWKAAFITGILFAIVHLPNPLLVLTTLILGVGTSYFFLRYRNIYAIAFAHGLLGTAVKYLLAQDLLRHGMRVGPGFWN